MRKTVLKEVVLSSINDVFYFQVAEHTIETEIFTKRSFYVAFVDITKTYQSSRE